MIRRGLILLLTVVAILALLRLAQGMHLTRCAAPAEFKAGMWQEFGEWAFWGGWYGDMPGGVMIFLREDDKRTWTVAEAKLDETGVLKICILREGEGWAMLDGSSP